MLRWFAFFACLYLLFSATVALAEPVTLRARPEANGPSITLGDIFQGASADVASRAIAPSPPPGQISVLSTPMLSIAASAAGLEWEPPAGLSEVRVVRPGGMRATVAPAGGSFANAGGGEAAVRRGETTTLVYEAPGISLSMRARAMQDGAVGQTIRFLNTSSNRTIDAVVTGPGVARATP